MSGSREYLGHTLLQDGYLAHCAEQVVDLLARGRHHRKGVLVEALLATDQLLFTVKSTGLSSSQNSKNKTMAMIIKERQTFILFFSCASLQACR